MLDIVITGFEIVGERSPDTSGLNVHVVVVNTDMTTDELRQALTDQVVFRMERTLKVTVSDA